jgi:hypothetical protein
MAEKHWRKILSSNSGGKVVTYGKKENLICIDIYNAIVSHNMHINVMGF